MAEKKGLGRGLSALFDENEHDLPEGEQASGDPVLVSISEVEPNRDQPRTTFDEEKLQELADSIREHGVISPITVAPLGGGRYRIIAGERRWRASRLAGLKKVPVRVLDVSEKEIVELSLIENLQREDLNVIEEARGYRRLSDEYGMTQEEIAARVGKSRPVVANALRLLTLPEEAVALLERGELSLAQGKALLSCPKREEIVALAQRAAREGLTVRELEALIKKLSAAPKQPKLPINRLYYDRLAQEIGDRLGRKAVLSPGKKGGKLTLEYYSDEDLNALAELLQKE